MVNSINELLRKKRDCSSLWRGKAIFSLILAIPECKLIIRKHEILYPDTWLFSCAHVYILAAGRMVEELKFWGDGLYGTTS
jgi:hypothetical protein